MGKLDELRRLAGGNIDESMGLARAPQVGATTSGGTPARWVGVTKSKAAAEIPTSRIVRDPNQPREEFDEAALARLAESLKTRGQLQPIRVRWDEEQGTYILVVGERRWRAARMAGLKTMTAIVVDGLLDAGELLSIQLIENALREDLRPVEQAKAFRALMDRNGWSISQLARELAIDQSSVSRALALLILPEAVQQQVEQGALPPATAYEVSKVEDPDEQIALAARVVEGKLSRAETAEEVRRRREAARPAKGRGRKPGGRKATSKAFRVAGCRVTVENHRGLTPETIVVALEEALRQGREAIEPSRQTAPSEQGGVAPDLDQEHGQAA